VQRNLPRSFARSAPRLGIRSRLDLGRRLWELVFLLFDGEAGRPGPLAWLVFTALVVGGCLLSGWALLAGQP
jgi:hypothetical protein